MECAAWLFMTCSGEISQVARPSLAAEAMSLSYGVDSLQWARVYWYEAMHVEFASQFILPTDQFPLQTPFRRDDWKVDDKSAPVWCVDCKSTVHINLRLAEKQYQCWSDDEITSKRIKAIALTDCSNAYASISSIAANSHDRSMGIILSYIRDNSATLRLSFSDACFNLSDIGTKRYGQRAIYRDFISSGLFKISFSGRKTTDAWKQMK